MDRPQRYAVTLPWPSLDGAAHEVPALPSLGFESLEAGAAVLVAAVVRAWSAPSR